MIRYNSNYEENLKNTILFWLLELFVTRKPNNSTFSTLIKTFTETDLDVRDDFYVSRGICNICSIILLITIELVTTASAIFIDMVLKECIGIIPNIIIIYI